MILLILKKRKNHISALWNFISANFLWWVFRVYPQTYSYSRFRTNCRFSANRDTGKPIYIPTPRDTGKPIYIPSPGSEPTVGSPLIEIQVYPYIFLLQEIQVNPYIFLLQEIQAYSYSRCRTYCRFSTNTRYRYNNIYSCSRFRTYTVGSPLIEIQVYPDIFLLKV